MSVRAGRRVRLVLQYDGADFYGWQMQADARTVQGELERALHRLTTQAVRTAAAGRTDRGVHALGQVVSCDVPEKWSSEELHRALNAVLPRDVWVVSVADAAPRFHARFDAIAREYEYRVGTEEWSQSPFHRRWCWPLARPLDRARLERAARAIVGDHSFLAFAKAGQEERGDRCVVERAEWHAWDAGLALSIRANRFLHHMVRYLVGTMVEVALHRRDEADVAALLGGGGLETSPPAPPEGLFLTRVYYPEEPASG